MLFIQKFYLVSVRTKPSDHLYLTYARVNAQGKALRRSYLIGTILKMFSGKTIEEVEETHSIDCVMTPESSLSFFLEGLQENRTDRESEETKLWNALARWYLEDPVHRDKVENLLAAYYKVPEDEPIGRAVARAL